jgi:hypothetical protein
MTETNRFLRSCAIALLWVAGMASTAYAHGGIAGPDELGPPVITSALLGIACYWLVLMWPSRKARGGQKTNKVVRRMAR